MKKIFLSITLLTIIYSANAQKFEVGVNGGLYTTWLLNKNVFDQDEKINHDFSGGSNFGLVATLNFNEGLALGMEINFATVNQKYSGDLGGGFTYETKTTIHYTEIPILLKLKSSEGGFYFEVGPKIGIRGKATEEYTVDPDPTGIFNTEENIEMGIKSTVISVAFGFGGRFDLSDKLALTAGLRFAVGLTDATEEFSEDAFAALGANDYIGTADTYAHMKQNGDYQYKKTTLATGGVQMSLVYKLGDK